ncbi:MAG: MBL fold metallo-hydrolase [Flavobacteriaceae bacterium]|nr:MBL fold metallo-hydrolase [Flavobacteriaceae bacterium]
MLKIHHFRNATMVIKTEKDIILVDPMLGEKGTMATFTYFRFKAQKNPIVSLPEKCKAILKKVTHCLITHKHPDHIDKEGERFLIENNIPVTCSYKDEKLFKSKGLNIVQTLKYFKRVSFLGVVIEGIPAKHGYGYIAKPMGNVMGFYIELPNQKSIYLSSDTIYTEAVDKVLKEYQPKISVVACGTAQLDLFQPLLMKMNDIIKFVENAPEKVIANHLEAVNHCPTTRKQLQKELENKGLSEKVIIPLDGEILQIN